MKKKALLISILTVALLVIIGIGFYPQRDRSEQQVLQSTYDHSKEYLLLRYRTDNILVNAENYVDHATWDNDMTALIQDWNTFENEVNALEKSAATQAEKTALNLNLVKSAHAYTAKEITDIYDKAPKFKGIATLAKHLGVDAKRAQLILNQAQDETTAEGWNEAGDTLQKLETSAVVIKDGCKVAGFVGGVVLTGGVAGLATAGTLTTTTTVVVGVDLALEVTEDGAQIAFGDKNKVSSFVKDIRSVTEPIANVLTITNIPSNLGTAFGKFDSVMIGLEQFRESAQEGKVIGIDLTNFEYHPSFQVIKQTKYPGELTVAEMEKVEVEQWLQSLNKNQEPMTTEEVEEFLNNTNKKSEQEEIVEEKEVTGKQNESSEVDKDTKSSGRDQTEETDTPNNEQPQETSTGSIIPKGIVGNYSGSAILQNVKGDVEAEDSLPVTLQLNESGTGTATVDGFSGEAQVAGSNVSFLVKMKQDGVSVYGKFDGKVSRSGNQTVISGDIRFSMMGINFATYSWSAHN